jgi:hypothetical protein
MTLQPFRHQDNPPTDIPCIAVGCHHCMTVETYSAEDRLESGVGEIEPRWEVVEWLKCVEPSCRSLVPLFLPHNETTIAATGKWRLRNIYCSIEHSSEPLIDGFHTDILQR